jgi:hypothetical protein
MSGPAPALSPPDDGDIRQAERAERSMWSASERQRDLARTRSTRTVIPAVGAADKRRYSNGRAARWAATLCGRQGRAPNARRIIARPGLGRSTMVEENPGRTRGDMRTVGP